MDKSNNPNIGSWKMSLKEMSSLARCVDGKFILFLYSGVALPGRELSLKLINDFCNCLAETGICSEDTSLEVMKQIDEDARNYHEHLKERLHNEAQTYKGRAPERREKSDTE